MDKNKITCSVHESEEKWACPSHVRQRYMVCYLKKTYTIRCQNKQVSCSCQHWLMVQKCNNPVRLYKNNTQKTWSLRKLTQIQQYHHHFKPRNAEHT
ncbi:hypothetical protein HanPSC8_Chr08g0334151 [Helianthus annuus]|nr:hypothetical protein HanPSC8_Chr08g0334151 [Helianthus annuus]